MTAPLKLPYAVANFEEIREEGYRLVDKTAYIREMEAYRVPVFLRPRRFGKTLWCSTLECYYDILRKEKFQALFGDLDIGRNPTPSRNSFMVLRLNFSQVQISTDMAVLERNFAKICQHEIATFLHHYREFFQGTVAIDTADTVGNALKAILAHSQQADLPPIYLIIDEYDNFANQFVTSGRDDLYSDLTTGDSFFRTFFKVVKAGCESRAIGKVFITGVLPITMDDLTSGFNIAEVVTLEPRLHGMLGFTQPEVDAYLEEVAQGYGIAPERIPETREVVRNWYNGYRFLSNAAETLYNSTILTYFLKYFALHDGEYPTDMIDPNVKTDVSWVKRLGYGETQALELMQTLLRGGGVPFDASSLSDRFNMERFFDRNHTAASLFFLGMLTIQDRETLSFPNQTLASIFSHYYTELAGVDLSRGYVEWFRAFRRDLDLGALFGGYWKAYVGQIPAQAFDKANENFFRTTFFELCTRHLSGEFSFGIEVNHPSGRSDWEMQGRPEGPHRHRRWIVEFKYVPRSSGVRLEELTQAPADAVAQLDGYKRDTLAQLPHLEIRTAVCLIAGREGFRWFDL